MSKIVIHPRSDWTHTKADGDGQIVKPHGYTLFVHYSEGGQPSTLAHARELIANIRSFHMGPERGWKDIGYSYLAAPMRDGKLHIWGGRGKGKVPAAQYGENTGNLAICLLTSSTDPYTPDELAVVVAGLAEFAHRYGASSLAPHSRAGRLHGYETDCPGSQLTAAIPRAAKAAGLRALP